MVVALAIVGSKFVRPVHNDLVTQRSHQAQWAQVDVVLQRRADLIPNLVATVKGYAQHERSFTDIANARAGC